MNWLTNPKLFDFLFKKEAKPFYVEVSCVDPGYETAEYEMDYISGAGLRAVETDHRSIKPRRYNLDVKYRKRWFQFWLKD